MIQRRLRQPDRAGRQEHPRLLIALVQQQPALVRFTHHHLVAEVAIVEIQRPRVRRVPAHLFVKLAGGETVGAVGHQEQRERLLRHIAVTGHHQHQRETADRRASIGDVGLLPIHHPAVVAPIRPCLEAAGVGPGIRFGAGDGADAAAGDDIGQEFLLLRATAEPLQREGGRHADHGADRQRLVGPGDLLDRQHGIHDAQPHSAPFLGERDAHHAEFAEFLE